MSTPEEKPSPLDNKDGYTLMVIPLHEGEHPHAHHLRAAQMRSTLRRNGHNYRHYTGRTKDGSERHVFAVAFDPATKERISKVPAKHARGVVHVDGKGNAVHASGRKLGKVQKVSAAEARKEGASFHGKKNHYVIR